MPSFLSWVKRVGAAGRQEVRNQQGCGGQGIIRIGSPRWMGYGGFPCLFPGPRFFPPTLDSAALGVKLCS